MDAASHPIDRTVHRNRSQADCVHRRLISDQGGHVVAEQELVGVHHENPTVGGFEGDYRQGTVTLPGLATPGGLTFELCGQDTQTRRHE